MIFRERLHDFAPCFERDLSACQKQAHAPPAPQSVQLHWKKPLSRIFEIEFEMLLESEYIDKTEKSCRIFRSFRVLFGAPFVDYL